MRMTKSLLVAAGLSQVGLGLWQAIAAGAFFRSLAAFGPQNDHYVRDVASIYLALGALLIIAAFRPAWRVPVLLLAVVQYGLHTLNHVLDLGTAHPSGLGPLNLTIIAWGWVALAVLLAVCCKEERG
jgi:hypothetical protein